MTSKSFGLKIASYCATYYINLKQAEKQNLSESFIGKQAEDLSQLIGEQIKPLYVSLGIVVPVKSCSIIHALSQEQHASVTEIAKSLNQSHQLVKQKLPRLQKLELITTNADPDDKRKTLYQLTERGKVQAQLLRDHSLTEVYSRLSSEVGADLYQILTAAIKGLRRTDLFTRYQELQNIKEK